MVYHDRGVFATNASTVPCTTPDVAYAGPTIKDGARHSGGRREQRDALIPIRCSPGKSLAPLWVTMPFLRISPDSRRSQNLFVFASDATDIATQANTTAVLQLISLRFPNRNRRSVCRATTFPAVRLLGLLPTDDELQQPALDQVVRAPDLGPDVLLASSAVFAAMKLVLSVDIARGCSSTAITSHGTQALQERRHLLSKPQKLQKRVAPSKPLVPIRYKAPIWTSYRFRLREVQGFIVAGTPRQLHHNGIKAGVSTSISFWGTWTRPGRANSHASFRRLKVHPKSLLQWPVRRQASSAIPQH